MVIHWSICEQICSLKNTIQLGLIQKSPAPRGHLTPHDKTTFPTNTNSHFPASFKSQPTLTRHIIGLIQVKILWKTQWRKQTFTYSSLDSSWKKKFFSQLFFCQLLIFYYKKNTKNFPDCIVISERTCC